MRQLIRKHNRNPLWVLIGWAGVLAGFLILSYYVVIAGWSLFYIWQMASGALNGATGEQADQLFADFLAHPWQLILWQTLFMVLTVFIISRGVVAGLETAIRWFMPMLFVLLLLLLGYAVTSDGWSQGVDFMFGFDFASLGPDAVLIALGQAFFTLSLGMGAIMAYVHKKTLLARESIQHSQYALRVAFLRVFVDEVASLLDTRRSPRQSVGHELVSPAECPRKRLRAEESHERDHRCTS